ncbi:MAG: methyltransferase domain-containing protein [Oscillospiraceae bacterium]
MTLPLICPVCGEKNVHTPLLLTDGKTLRCPKNHSFDISAKGYVNLLLTQHKNVKDPGDSKEMVAARRLFLDSGAYSGLRDELCACAAKYSADMREPLLLDCGCGEGYYTVGMYEAIAHDGGRVVGVDISKNALAAAHSRINAGGVKRDIFCAAASVFRLPFEDCSFDMAAVIFAPFQREELLRVMKPGGVVITAIPGERHLFGLKSLLYDQPRLNEVKPYDVPGMELLEKREVHGELRLTSQEMLNALFTMTPYYYKTSPHDSDRLYGWFGTSDIFETEIDFQILCYRVK